MRVLITGGTGFIGSRLALRCLRQGDRVRILAQENTEAEEQNREILEDAGAEIILASVTDPSQLLRAVEGIDVVFHLAATQHEMNVPDQRFWDVNVDGTEHMLRASADAGVRRFVHGSTIGVYGVASGRLDEASSTAPENIYGQTKLAGERKVVEYSDRLPVVVVRIPEVYGPGDRRLLKLFRLISKGRFPIVGKGENLHHLIFVQDLVDGLLLVARAPEASGKVFQFAGPRPITTREMVESVARAVGEDPPSLRLPLWPFTVLATVLEVALRPLGIQPPLHRRRLDFFKKSFELSGAKARQVLGFDPQTDFADGAATTADWYREQGLLRVPEKSSSQT